MGVILMFIAYLIILFNSDLNFNMLILFLYGILLVRYCYFLDFKLHL